MRTNANQILKELNDLVSIFAFQDSSTSKHYEVQATVSV